MTTMENALADKLEADGYTITPCPANTTGYTFEAVRGRECVAVLVKEYKAKVNVAYVAKFQDYLSLDVAKRFTSGWLISASGFFNPALTHAKTEEPPNLRLGTFSDGNLTWAYAPGLAVSQESTTPELPQKANLRYFGVFTSKGGVGKTTVAAHLAGAFALLGFDVILVDLDPDKNLRKLFLQDPRDEEGDASLYVPAKGRAGATITVLNHDQWNEKHYPDIKIVVCDCSPHFKENPPELVRKFDYCIIPTTLNPLGVAKNADVITRTFSHIREMNQKAEMFALINGYDTAADVQERNNLLLMLLKEEISKYTRNDSRCKFIDPKSAMIRRSTALYYWGIHIVKRATPELAFKEVAGRSYPRMDFLQLAEYLEHHTDIDEVAGKSHPRIENSLKLQLQEA